MLIFSEEKLYIGANPHNKVLIEVNELGYYLTDDISPSHRSSERQFKAAQRLIQ